MSASEPVGFNPKSTPHKQAALNKLAPHLLGACASVAHHRGVPCVIADMTAGPGLYEGHEGSPLIFARHMTNLMAAHGYKMRLVCVEQVPERLAALRAVMGMRYSHLPVSYYSSQLEAKNAIQTWSVGLTYWDPTRYNNLNLPLLCAFGKTHDMMDILITRECLATKRMLGWERTATSTLTIQDYLALTGKKRNYLWQYAKHSWWTFGFADNWETRPQEKMGGLVRVDSVEGQRLYARWTAFIDQTDDTQSQQGELPWE